MSQLNVAGVQPVPIDGVGGGSALDALSESPDAMFEVMRRMGAKNLVPPLPRAKYLKVKATGRVIPYDDMMAEQTDLVECCDKNGNTDPEAWANDLLPEIDTNDSEQRELLMLEARNIAVAQARAMSESHKVPGVQQEVNAPVYPDGVMTYDEMTRLLSQLK